jgi:hypothetical protein
MKWRDRLLSLTKREYYLIECLCDSPHKIHLKIGDEEYACVRCAKIKVVKEKMEAIQ